jgi:glycosyltransferase involved in cell wall biosynthesis
LKASGFDPVILAVPRQGWNASGFEDPTLATRRGLATVRGSDAGDQRLRHPEVIVCMHWSTLPVAVGLKFLFGSRVIYDEHDFYEMLALETSGPAWLRRTRSWCVRRVHSSCLPYVDAVTCIRMVDSRLKQQLQLHASTVVELHNYPSRRWRATGRTRPSDSGVALVYVGSIWQVKGGGSMLDAFEILRADDSLPPLSLQVFGRGDPEIEERLATSAGVVYHGSSSWDQIAGFLTTNDCVGLALLDDTPRYRLVSTNCHKVFEYLASGAPVVVSEVGDLPAIVRDLDGGWTIAAGFSADDLAKLLRTVVVQHTERRRRGDAAADIIRRDDLTWEHEWEKVERLGVLGPQAGTVPSSVPGTESGELAPQG